MHKANLTTRAVAGFIDLLLVLGLTRLPDMIGVLSATGYILIRDGLFENQSIGKKVIGLMVASADGTGGSTGYRESIIRNTTLAIAYLLFMIPLAGWVLGPLLVIVECLVALGDEQGMRIGDLLAGTWTIRAASEGQDGKPDSGQEDETVSMNGRDSDNSGA